MSAALPAQLDAGQGLETQVVDTWSMPAWVVLSLLIAAAVYVLAIYLHERGAAGLPTKLFLAGVRLSLVALVLLMLYGWVRERHRTDLPDVVIVVDDSASMALEDYYDDEQLRAELSRRVTQSGFDAPTRFDLARWLLLGESSDLLERLRGRYHVKFYFVGESARVQAGDENESLAEKVRRQEPEQQQSRLGKGLRDVIEAQRGRPTAAIILLSDGVTTEGRSLTEAAEYARLKSIPIFAVGLGNDQSPRDLRVNDLLVDDVVFVGDVVNFDFKLSGSGYQGESVTVRLREEGSRNVLAEQQVTVGGDGQSQPVRITYRPPHKGDFKYVVEVDSLEGEADDSNNRQMRQVSVRDETIRVLLVQAYPNYEYRFLKPLLERQVKSDEAGGGKSIELSVVLQEAGEGYSEQDESARIGFPVSREELFRFDVILFGDVDPSEFTTSMLENLAAFVKERGGGVVFMAGPRYTPLAYRNTPLAELMPIDLNTVTMPNPAANIEQSTPVRPTRLGLISPQMQLADSPVESAEIWRRLPGVYWMLDAPDRKPAARVLAEHPTRTGSDGSNLPIIMLYYVGAGKVIFHATDETFQWRFRAGDAYFGRYWIQTIRYLSRSKLLGQNRAAELTADREEYRHDETVRLRLRFFDDRQAPPEDDGVTIVLERQGGRRQQVNLRRDAASRGIFEGAVANLVEGTYRTWVASPTFEGNPPAFRFAVVAPPGEHARMEMDSTELRRAANASRGEFYDIATVDKLLGDLPRGRQVRIQSLPPTHVWSLPNLPTLFDIWLLPAAFVGLIVLEWLLRKRAGML
ncbi:MAG: VWA domain-containing protein [Pirellulaceae bacterium]